jgi:hypothetical protein
LQPEWDVGAAGSIDSTSLSQTFHAALSEPMQTARNDGDFDQAITGAARTFEAIYETPYLSHSPMEPMNATVHLQPDRLDVWFSTQAVDRALPAAAKFSGLKPEQVYIHNGFVGGGFGRRNRLVRGLVSLPLCPALTNPGIFGAVQQAPLMQRGSPEIGTNDVQPSWSVLWFQSSATATAVALDYHPAMLSVAGIGANG